MPQGSSINPETLWQIRDRQPQGSVVSLGNDCGPSAFRFGTATTGREEKQSQRCLKPMPECLFNNYFGILEPELETPFANLPAFVKRATGAASQQPY